MIEHRRTAGTEFVISAGASGVIKLELVRRFIFLVGFSHVASNHVGSEIGDILAKNGTSITAPLRSAVTIKYLSKTINSESSPPISLSPSSSLSTFHQLCKTIPSISIYFPSVLT